MIKGGINADAKLTSAKKSIQEPADADRNRQESQERPHGIAKPFAHCVLGEKSKGQRYRQSKNHHGLKMSEDHPTTCPSSFDPKPICSTSKTHRKFKTPAVANRRVP